MRAPRFLRVLQLLEDQDARALAHDEPVAVEVERTARLLRGVVAPRKRLLRAEARRATAGVMAASAPPVTMTSASPRRMQLAASAMACAALAQAVTVAELGPRSP